MWLEQEWAKYLLIPVRPACSERVLGATWLEFRGQPRL